MGWAKPFWGLGEAFLLRMDTDSTRILTICTPAPECASDYGNRNACQETVGSSTSLAVASWSLFDDDLPSASEIARQRLAVFKILTLGRWIHWDSAD